MFGLLTLLAYDREDLMVAALAALLIAGAIVAVGAWLLLFREVRREARPPALDPHADPPPADEGGAGSLDAAEPQASEVAGDDRTYS